MQTIAAFVDFCLGFVPFLSLVAIMLFAFWILTKMIPSLNEWMTSTDGTVETEAEAYARRRSASPSFDQYV